MLIRKDSILAFCLIFFLLFFLVPGCKKESSSSKIKIGFILKTMQEERYQKDKKYFIDKAEALGAEVFFDSCNNDEQIQLSKFEDMLSKGVSVIVFQPVNTGTAGNMVKMAQGENVRVVGYDSLIQNGPLDVHIMDDAFKVGVLQANALIEWMKQKGKLSANIVLIKGQGGDSYAKELTDGVKSILSVHPEITVIAEQSHDGWSPDKAMATAENALSKYSNNVDGFLCNNSGMARGVIAALKAQNLDSVNKVFVAGADADLINVRFVNEGIQAIDVFAAIKPLAEYAAEVAVLIAQNPDAKPVDLFKDKCGDEHKIINNGYQDVYVIYGPIFLVSKDTIMDTVVKYEYFTKEEIYGKK